MNSFAIARPDSFRAASKLVTDGKYSLPVIKSGGIDLIDHMKEGLTAPDLLVEVRGLREDDRRTTVTQESDHFRFEAAATLTDIGESPLVSKSCPVVAQSVLSAATPAIRNMATAAGNLLQRPRCWYYRNSQFDCLKKGGSTCYAVGGENQYHAIFGDGPCHIVHPSNLAPALMVTSGVVHVMGGKRKEIPIADLFHMPDRGVRSENNLEPGEIITHITCAMSPRSGFYGVKEKQSFDWPMAFACVSLDMDGETIKGARVCAGAVAPVPWMLPKVADALAGVNSGDDAGIRNAAAIASRGARPMTDNAYKVKLLEVVVYRAVVKALGREPEGLA